ncbi:hypothetical protein PIB30_066648 [Stylosanthes scabra]|uniref:Uncharacterized protein n=1 Tax=Stylosanthes scabra TaxID=79078 RepID=A0ABU6QPD0_9FABA|nr:hypothetical protein [Stylosanthes scabra]
MRRKKRGRPVSTRIRNDMDLVERAEKRYSLCRQEGHTERGCPNTPHGDHPGRPRALGDGGAWMRSRTGVAGDPPVAARAPSGRTDHRAAGGVRSVMRSHKTMAAATGCDS